MVRKIVWLCAFSNYELAEKLGEKKSKIVSPWISEFINLFRNTTDFNIYIISPNYLNNSNLKLNIGNIEVHLYKFHSNYLPEKLYNLSFNYPYTKKNVSKLINDIQPDLIHLFGAENPVYSSAIVNIQFSCPILVSPQAFIRNSPKTTNAIKNFIRWNRIRYESKILSQQKYFTVATDDVTSELNLTNLNSSKFKMSYPTSVNESMSELNSSCKDFDISFFGQISKEKGAEDFLKIVHKLKYKFPRIKAVIIGGGNATYIKHIKQLVHKLDLNENILFAGFQKTQNEAFKLLVRSKVYILPTYYDGLPGTIREAMYLKVAVVAYSVGGIPRLNDKHECIKCVPVHNLDMMLNEVSNLLENEENRILLIKNAFNLITQEYNNKNILRDLINIYNRILE